MGGGSCNTNRCAIEGDTRVIECTSVEYDARSRCLDRDIDGDNSTEQQWFAQILWKGSGRWVGEGEIQVVVLWNYRRREQRRERRVEKARSGVRRCCPADEKEKSEQGHV